MHDLEHHAPSFMDSMEVEPSPRQHRRKARRAPREKRLFKPYSNLTWQERKQLQEKDDPQSPDPALSSSAPLASNERLGKRRRRRHNVSREQPPPAPKVTTQFILAERLPPRDPEDVEDLPEDSPEGSSDSSDYFDRAYETCFTDDLNDLKREDLIRLIRERDRELEALRAEVNELKAGANASS